MKNFMVAGILLLPGPRLCTAGQHTDGDEVGRVLALEKMWNRALEQKDIKALELLLTNTMVSVQTDGQAAIKKRISGRQQSADYQLSQAVREHTQCRTMQIRPWWLVSFASKEQTKAKHLRIASVSSTPG